METVNTLSSQALGQGTLMNPPKTLTLTLSQCFVAIICAAMSESSKPL